MALRVTFIGSGNAFADGGRSHACIHISAPGVSLLLDCGGSSLPAIKREIDPEAIDAIAISHLHGDHFGGIPYLVIEQHFAGRERRGPLHLRRVVLRHRRPIAHLVSHAHGPA
jgi:ribonuclease BN (tRNA processing enzyme)